MGEPFTLVCGTVVEQLVNEVANKAKIEIRTFVVVIAGCTLLVFSKRSSLKLRKEAINEGVGGPNAVAPCPYGKF